MRFPVNMNKKLNQASDDQRNNIEIICNGTGLHWPDLDEDLTITGIIDGRWILETCNSKNCTLSYNIFYK